MADEQQNSASDTPVHQVPGGAQSPVHKLTVSDIHAPGNVGVPSIAIDWSRSVPWFKLVTTTLPIAWRASHLLLCAFGILLTQLYSQGIAWLFGFNDLDSTSWFVGREMHGLFGISFWDARPFPAFGFVEVWGRFFSPLTLWLAEPTVQRTAYAIALLIGLIVIWGAIGGCMIRRSLLELGTGSVPLWKECIRWVRRRLQSIYWTLSMPAFVVLLMGLGAYLLGLFSNIPVVGEWIAGLLMIPFAIASLGFGWAVALWLFGFPLAISTVVADRKADAFDGISRSAAYVFQRPVQWVLFGVLFQVISLVGGELLGLVLGIGFRLMETSFGIGAISNVEEGLLLKLYAFQAIPAYLIGAFGLSYFWTSQAAMFLLLQKSVDSAEFDSISLDELELAPPAS